MSTGGFLTTLEFQGKLCDPSHLVLDQMEPDGLCGLGRGGSVSPLRMGLGHLQHSPYIWLI